MGSQSEIFQNSEYLQIILTEMGHPQPATTLGTDGLGYCRVMNRTTKIGCSIEINMKFYWVRECF